MKTNHPHTPERWTCQYGAVYADDGVTRILLAHRLAQLSEAHEALNGGPL